MSDFRGRVPLAANSNLISLIIRWHIESLQTIRLWYALLSRLIVKLDQVVSRVTCSKHFVVA